MQKRMTHVVVDLETFSTDQDATILSIGACYFDPPTGNIGDTFYKNITWQSNFDIGRSVSEDTLKFWFNQDPAARDAIMQDGIDLKIALELFSAWFLPKTAIWGNGPTFDVSILQNAYKMLDMNHPWEHWNIFDARTSVKLAVGKAKRTDIIFEGVKHHALHDAIHEAKYISLMWQVTRGKK